MRGEPWMKHFKNILVAYDGSSYSNQALEIAETLAVDNKAALTVIYVHDKSIDKTVNYDNPTSDDLHAHKAEPFIGTGAIPTPTGSPSVNKQTVIHDNKPDEILADARVNLKSELNVTFEALTGNPAKSINDYAEDYDMDLIVIGHRGISGIKKLVMGSVSQKVTNDAHCAVLVIK